MQLLAMGDCHSANDGPAVRIDRMVGFFFRAAIRRLNLLDRSRRAVALLGSDSPFTSSSMSLGKTEQSRPGREPAQASDQSFFDPFFRQAKRGSHGRRRPKQCSNPARSAQGAGNARELLCRHFGLRGFLRARAPAVQDRGQPDPSATGPRPSGAAGIRAKRRGNPPRPRSAGGP